MNNYSNTKCPKCSSNKFEFVEDIPSNSNWKFQYLRCSACNTFLQILPFHDTNNKIDILQEDIKKIKTRMGIF